MKKIYSLLLYCTTASMLLWFAGCSTEQSGTVNGPSNVGTEEIGASDGIILNSAEADLSASESDVASPLTACCLSPSIQCISSTDTSITIRVCAGSTGAPGGLYVQWYEVPEGTACADFYFPSSGVPSKFLSGSACLPPYGCITITIKGLDCGSTYAFRAKAINQYGCYSPWGAKVCCTTADCEQAPPCLDEPVIACEAATDTSITVRITAGTSGAPAGVVLQYAELPAGTACADFVWPASGVAYKTTAAIAANGYVTKEIRGLECGTTYVFRAKAKECLPNCASDWTANLCCATADCEQAPPCLDVPTIVCYAATDTSITVRITAGASGAPAGVRLQYAVLPEGTACADFVWPVSGVSYKNTAAIAANGYVDKEIRGLECGTTYVFRVKAKECLPNCASDWSPNLCCATDDCEQAPPCLDVPTVVCYAQTDTSITIRVTAGASGAPSGFLVQYALLPAGTACADFVWPASGVAYKNTAAVAANGYVTKEIRGLACGSTYVFRALAKECLPNCPSDFSANICCTTADCEQNPPPDGCVRTQGYWKNHTGDWPVTSLTIGGVTYTQTQLLSVLNAPSHGNAVLILGKQLIAALLNVAAGSDPSCIEEALASANTRLTNNNINLTTSVVRTNTILGARLNTIASRLNLYNNGLLPCAEHCD